MKTKKQRAADNILTQALNNDLEINDELDDFFQDLNIPEVLKKCSGCPSLCVKGQTEKSLIIKEKLVVSYLQSLGIDSHTELLYFSLETSKINFQFF